VFVRSGTNWSQQAYLKASNTGATDWFGFSVAVAADTLIVGAPQEASNATGVNGNQSDNSFAIAGAAYVFVRRGTNWSQQAYLKASNTGGSDQFGWVVAISGDTVLAGAPQEDSNATGVNNSQSDNSAVNSGAAYVFTGLGIGPELSIARDGTGGYFIRFNGITGFNYELQRAPTVTGPWASNAAVTTLTSGPIEFHDTNAPPTQAFYRMVQQ
jgi:hypothetical protein